MLLGIGEVERADASDALAIAITHAIRGATAAIISNAKRSA